MSKVVPVGKLKTFLDARPESKQVVYSFDQLAKRFSGSSRVKIEQRHRILRAPLVAIGVFPDYQQIYRSGVQILTNTILIVDFGYELVSGTAKLMCVPELNFWVFDLSSTWGNRPRTPKSVQTDAEWEMWVLRALGHQSQEVPLPERIVTLPRLPFDNSNELPLLVAYTQEVQDEGEYLLKHSS